MYREPELSAKEFFNFSKHSKGISPIKTFTSPPLASAFLAKVSLWLTTRFSRQSASTSPDHHCSLSQKDCG